MWFGCCAARICCIFFLTFVSSNPQLHKDEGNICLVKEDIFPSSSVSLALFVSLISLPSRPQSVSSQETLGHRKSSVCVPRALGQLFILLQYQTLAQRIKVMVRKAENLAKLTRIPGAPGKDRVLERHASDLTSLIQFNLCNCSN